MVAVALLVVAGCSANQPGDSDGTSGQPELQSGEDQDLGEADGEAEEEGRVPGADEAEEEAHEAQERVEALDEAIAAGTFGADVSSFRASASGWSDAQLLNPTTDDWEPAVAADHNRGFVYVLTTRYGKKICPSDCPSPYIPLTVSKDGGKTWGPQKPLCRCKGSFGQFDPIIETVPKTGDVYAAFLNGDTKSGFSTAFVRSTDHGKTWSKPVHVYGDVKWTDKPELTMSRNGKHIYVAWNGPDGGDSYVGVSHDYGKTWTPVRVTHGKKYFYAYDGTTLPDGTIVFSESALIYGSSAPTVSDNVWHYALISRNQGKTWKNVLVAKVKRGQECVAKGCGPDYYAGQTSVASNHAGHLVFAYEGAAKPLGPMQVYVSTSRNEGRTWRSSTALSVKGENATGPRVDMGPGGKPRIWYMQTSNDDDPDAWNVWFRSSTNEGTKWHRPLRLSNAVAGPGYVSPDGFDEIYGDYGEIAVTNKGKTVAVWGEGFDYTGPGGTWIAVKR